MQNGSFDRCAPDKFYDSGGSGGAYGSDENFITTICASNAGEFIILDFLSFSTQLNVDISNLPDGMYFLRIVHNENGKVSLQKMLKQN